MKTLTRKLFLSIMAVALAVIALGTTTYAWFSMNTQVNATGMQVKATASRNLLISNNQNDGFGSSLTLTTNLTTLLPCSTVKAASPSFYKINTISGMTPESFNAGNSTFVAATANTSNTGDYVKTAVWLKSTGLVSSSLKCNVGVNNDVASALDPCLRVMLVTTEGQYIYTPVAGASAWKGVASLDENGKAVLSTDNETVTSSTDTILASLAADTAVKVDIYVWYEGQDAACTANNAVTLSTATFTFTFSVSAS